MDTVLYQQFIITHQVHTVNKTKNLTSNIKYINKTKNSCITSTPYQTGKWAERILKGLF